MAFQSGRLALPMLNLPDNFQKNILSSFGEKGREWLTRLPGLIDETSQRWNLIGVRQVPNLSYNFVAFAKQNGEEVILKIGVPNPELVSEMRTLQLFDGEGTCRLLSCDEEKGFLLIERLKPGKMLADLQNDEERTHTAIDVMQRIWRPAPNTSGPFIQLTDWFGELKNIRPYFKGGTGPFPKKILERVETFLPGLFEGDACLLHGDFHHFNILSSERGWLAIDPKGVVGPAGYEIGPLMLNPWIKPMDRTQFKAQTARRVDILVERLGWTREKIIQWSLAHAILSAYWDLDLDPHYPLAAAEVFANMK